MTRAAGSHATTGVAQSHRRRAGPPQGARPMGGGHGAMGALRKREGCRYEGVSPCVWGLVWHAGGFAQ